jgi:tetratricopeptide (TPR) repeat protein
MSGDSLNLEARLSTYQKTLNELSLDSESAESTVRSLFIARDGLAQAIKNVGAIDEQTFGRIASLDKHFKALAKSISSAISEETFVNWREVSQPPKSAWWWFLDRRVTQDDERAETAKQKRDALWTILTVLFVSIAINLIAEIVKRFFSGGRDWLSTMNTIAQAVLIVLNAGLGVLALGTLTDPGRLWAEQLLTSLGLFKKYGAKKRLLIASSILILTIGFRLSLPFIARIYVEQGTRQVVQKNQSKAMESYQRATSLDPDNAFAHYGLAIAHENFHNYEDAIAEYRSAVALDSRFLEAQNNLARLYLWRGKDKDFENALQTLNDALNQSPSEQDVRYVLLKNRGWANYELKHYTQAEGDLRQALNIDQNRPGRIDDSSDRAAPHCLLGYVLEATNKGGAKEEWEDCVRYSAGEEDLKAEWISTAKSRLMDGGR